MSQLFTKPVLLAVLAVLPGCAQWEQHAQDSLPAPRAAYEDKQISVSATRSTHAISYLEGKTHVSEGEAAYLNDFLSRTVHGGEKTVMVEQPGRRADRLTRQRVAVLTQSLRKAGYHVHPYPGAETVPGQVQIAVDHLIAQAPARCPDWDIHRNFAFGAEPIPNHGCADRMNLAAMVANPQDLVVGRVPSAPMGHGALRGEVNYRAGTLPELQEAGEIVAAD